MLRVRGRLFFVRVRACLCVGWRAVAVAVGLRAGSGFRRLGGVLYLHRLTTDAMDVRCVHCVCVRMSVCGCGLWAEGSAGCQALGRRLFCLRRLATQGVEVTVSLVDPSTSHMKGRSSGLTSTRLQHSRLSGAWVARGSLC